MAAVGLDGAGAMGEAVTPATLTAIALSTIATISVAAAAAAGTLAAAARTLAATRSLAAPRGRKVGALARTLEGRRRRRLPYPGRALAALLLERAASAARDERQQATTRALLRRAAEVATAERAAVAAGAEARAHGCLAPRATARLLGRRVPLALRLELRMHDLHLGGLRAAQSVQLRAQRLGALACRRQRRRVNRAFGGDLDLSPVSSEAQRASCRSASAVAESGAVCSMASEAMSPDAPPAVAPSVADGEPLAPPPPPPPPPPAERERERERERGA